MFLDKRGGEQLFARNVKKIRFGFFYLFVIPLCAILLKLFMNVVCRVPIGELYFRKIGIGEIVVANKDEFSFDNRIFFWNIVNGYID